MNSNGNTPSVELVRWTFTVSQEHRVEIETHLLDLGLELQARGDDILVVTWDEASGEILIYENGQPIGRLITDERISAIK